MSARFPAPLREFVELVNRGRYWESHEALEDAWRDSGSEFYHGLILYASAFVHAVRGTPHGIRAQLGKALRALDGFPRAYLGLDVGEVRDHAVRCRRVVEEREGDPDVDWEEEVPLPRLELREARIRGDEPELA